MGKTATKKEAVAKNSATRKVSSFIVKTNAYQETFTNLDDAKSKYEELKTNAVKNKQATKVKLFSRIGTTTSEICGVDIKEDHFDNE